MGERRESARFGILTNQFLSSPVFVSPDFLGQMRATEPTVTPRVFYILGERSCEPHARGRAVASDRSECVWLLGIPNRGALCGGRCKSRKTKCDVKIDAIADRGCARTCCDLGFLIPLSGWSAARVSHTCAET